MHSKNASLQSQKVRGTPVPEYVLQIQFSEKRCRHVEKLSCRACAKQAPMDQTLFMAGKEYRLFGGGPLSVSGLRWLPSILDRATARACRQTSSVVDRVSHEYINKTGCRVHSPKPHPGIATDGSWRTKSARGGRPNRVYKRRSLSCGGVQDRRTKWKFLRRVGHVALVQIGPGRGLPSVYQNDGAWHRRSRLLRRPRS